MVMNGLSDPSLGINILRGGSVRYMNQAFGSTGKANEGSTTILPSDDDWAFHCVRYANLAAKNVSIDRTWGHDPQAWQEIMRAGKERVAAAILEQLDAAHVYGIRCIITLGGFSDPNTCSQAYGLFDPSSQDYRRFVELAAHVADEVSGHPALLCLELLNEPDYMHVITGYWRRRYPAGRYELLNAYAVWQDGIISAVRGKQIRPGTPLGMGTAMDSTLYCDERGNGAMPWMTAECIEQIIPRMAAGCDVWTPHVYLGENSQLHRDVLFRQKFPSFAQAARKAGKPLVFGETGALYQGGTYDPMMASTLDQLGADRCWMIRWWNPTEYRRPPIPTRIPYHAHAPDVSSEQKPPVEPPLVPSDPAHETPEGETPEKPPSEADSDGAQAKPEDVPSIEQKPQDKPESPPESGPGESASQIVPPVPPVSGLARLLVRVIKIIRKMMRKRW